MSQQTTARAKERPLLFFAICGLLIVEFLWRVLTPAHEYPLRTEQVLTMALDAGLIAGLFAIKNSGPRGLWWAALGAGVCLFLIRISSDSGWWTGHLIYQWGTR